MKHRVLGALLAVVLLFAAGCSAPGEPAAAAEATPAAAEATPAATEAPAPEAEVQTVNVALEAGSKPLSFEDENGSKVGYEVDVLNAVDELIPEYAFNLEFVEADATQIGLETGKYVLIGGGLYKTPERVEKYLIPDAINGVSLINIYVHEDDTGIKSLDDLVGKKLVPSTPNGGIYNLLTEYNAAHPDAQITITTGEGVSVADRFKSVDAKEYDALVLPNNLGFSEIKQELGLKIKAVEEPVKINGTYFALAKGQEDLSAKVEAALTTLRENGTLSELSLKWYGEDTIQFFQG
ncbi:MAG TPA: transporter substrate-binding domain-containing protein [Feifaniaceae bacterium]|nr:transporter substrate-binding domain-containing protein [Feifaniaceae bacterium]